MVVTIGIGIILCSLEKYLFNCGNVYVLQFGLYMFGSLIVYFILPACLRKGSFKRKPAF